VRTKKHIHTHAHTHTHPLAADFMHVGRRIIVESKREPLE